jgi:hypothetical protein
MLGWSIGENVSCALYEKPCSVCEEKQCPPCEDPKAETCPPPTVCPEPEPCPAYPKQECPPPPLSRRQPPNSLSLSLSLCQVLFQRRKWWNPYDRDPSALELFKNFTRDLPCEGEWYAIDVRLCEAWPRMTSLHRFCAAGARKCTKKASLRRPWTTFTPINIRPTAPPHVFSSSVTSSRASGPTYTSLLPRWPLRSTRDEY